MKKQFYIAFILSVSTFFSAIPVSGMDAQESSIDLCTFNIYKRTADDDEHAWSTRRVLVKNIISTYDFDIFGTQESDRTQVNDILTLGGYKDYGVSMSSGLQSTGWRNAIIYKYDRFQIVESGVFWFSETPDVVSIGWDADQNRNCNWAKMLDKNTGKYFYYFCAHFDHLGTLARINSAKMICDTLPKIAGDYPAFFMGDLNSIETSEPILTLNNGLHDSREISITDPQGPYGTGHGWRIDVNVRRIDYIYTYNGNGRNRIEVEEYEVIDKTYDGKSPSDHWPVRIKARLVPGTATYRVTSKLDDGGPKTLRTVISQTQAGDSIIIDRAFVDTIKLNAAISLDKNIGINGNGAVIQVVSPGESTYRVFSIGSGSELMDTICFSDIKIRGGNISGLSSSAGNGGVVLINKNTNFKSSHVEFSNGKAVYGGALHCVDTTGVRIEMDNCRFTNNSSTNNAGAFYLKAISGRITNCVFDNNTTARNGSALVSNKQATISNTVFRNNVSTTSLNTDYGAAVFNSGGGNMSITNCTFESNSVTQYGTGAFACSGSTTNSTITNSTFWNNTGVVASAIYNKAGSLNLIHCTVAGNKSASGENAAYYAYPAPEAQNKIVNSILAYNYNLTGKNDLWVAENALLSGTNNLLGIQTGAGGLSNPIGFVYGGDTQAETPLFSQYRNTEFNSSTIKQPVLADNGGQTQTIAIDENSAAYRMGIENFPEIVLPEYDQRNFSRYMTPCIGAFEVICDFPEQLSVNEIKGQSARLSWQGTVGHYEIAYKPMNATTWNTIETLENNFQLSGLLPSTPYEWKLRSVCDADYAGEWLQGNNFTTPFMLLVTSGLDDGGPGTLRYIVDNAQPGDSILIAVDTITLSNAIELKKNISINGQHAVIKPIEISISNYRIFTLGADLTTPDSIRLYNMELFGGDLTSNTSTAANGGILFLYKNVNLLAKNILFKSGKATYGGAIHCNDSTGTRIFMDDCSFLNNESVNNAGAFYVKAVCELKHCLFEENKTSSNGSALTSNHKLHIEESVFRNNSAIGSGAYGGVIFNASGGKMLVENSTFESNSALTIGAGAFGCSTGTTTSTFVNSTFHGNSGVTAACFYNRSGIVNLIHCTITGNTAKSSNTGAYMAYDATNVLSTFVNNIFAYNYNSTMPFDLWLGTSCVTNGTNNLIANANFTQDLQNTVFFTYAQTPDNDPSLFSDYFFEGSNKIPVLADNGGLTKTIALSGLQSAAYGIGTNEYAGFQMPIVDQRGSERNSKPCAGSFQIISDTGLSTGYQSFDISIYPNPVRGEFTIKADALFYKADLYALSGTKVATFNSTRCNLSYLPVGIYFIQVFTARGVGTQKIVVY